MITIDEATYTISMLPIYILLFWIARSLQHVKDIVFACPYCMERRRKILDEAK